MKKIFLLLMTLIMLLVPVKQIHAEELDPQNVYVQLVIFSNTGDVKIEDIEVSCPSGTYKEVFDIVPVILSGYYKDFSYYIQNQWGTKVESHWGCTENNFVTVVLTDYEYKDVEIPETVKTINDIYKLMNTFFIMFLFFNIMPYLNTMLRNFFERR